MQYQIGIRLDRRAFYGYILNAWDGKHSRWISDEIEGSEDEIRRVVEKHVRDELASIGLT